MPNKRGNRGSNRIPKIQERPPLSKLRIKSTYFGGGNVGNLQASQVRSLVLIEKGDSSQVGPLDRIEVQVGEADISAEDELEHNLEALPLNRESQTNIIELELAPNQSGEKTKSDSIIHVHAQQGKKIGIKERSISLGSIQKEFSVRMDGKVRVH